MERKLIVKPLSLIKSLFAFSTSLLTGCMFIANLSSIDSVKITAHDIQEVGVDTVVIKLDGLCPEKVVSLDVIVNGENKSIKSHAVDLITKGDTVAYCESDNHIALRYSLPDPNYVGPLDFKITAIKGSGPTPPGFYTLQFQRPPIPAPVISTQQGRDFFTNQTAPTLEGTCLTERITGIQYRVNGDAWQDISCVDDAWSIQLGPFTGNPPTENLFEIRTSNSHSSYEYSKITHSLITVDTVPPNTSPVLLGLTSLQDSVVDAWLGGVYPIVHFEEEADFDKIEIAIMKATSSEFVCPLIVVPAKSPYAFTEDTCPSVAWDENDEYLLTVFGFDKAGNRSLTETSLSFFYDGTAPALQFTSTPPATTKSNYASFSWMADPLSGSPLGTPAQCFLDNKPLSSCNPSFTLDDLSVGNHTLRITIKDDAGNSSTISHSWSVDADTVAPLCSFTSAEAEWTNQTSLSFTFECSDNDGVRDVLCQLNNNTWQSCDSHTEHLATGLTSGTHFFRIRAKDHAGNFSPTLARQFKVDVTLPTLTWTLLPAAITNQVVASLSFTAIDAESGVATTECRLDAGAFGPCASPFIITGPLLDGEHTVTLRVHDVAGNVASIDYTWEVDTVPPNPPIMGDDGEAGRKPTYTWSSGGGNGNGVYRYKLNDSDLESGATETTELTFSPLFDLPFGSHILYVQERDAAGNWSTSSLQTFDAKCAAGEFFDSGNCQTCPLGTYQPAPNFSTACLSTPVGSYNPAEGGTNPISCPTHSSTVAVGSTLLSECLGNAGYFECQTGTCSEVGVDYYSPNLENNRLQCPENSFTAGLGVDAGTLTSCMAGIDFYDADEDPSTAPVAVGVGSYSPYRDNELHLCTNKPLAATSVVYEGTGGGSNNCPIGMVLTCDAGYIPNGKTCFKNSPNEIIFTNVYNRDPETLTESNAVTVTNFDGPLTATCTDCTGIARNGVWGGTEVEGFYPGDTIAIRRNSAYSFGASVLSSVSLGTTTSSNWVVGTRNAYTCNGGDLGTIQHGQSVTAFSTNVPLPPTNCAAIQETRHCNDGALSGSYGKPSCQEGCAGTPWGNVASGFSSTAYSSTLPTSSCASNSQTRTCSNGVMSGTFTATSCTSGCTGTPWGNVPSGYSATAYSSATPADSCSNVSETRTCTNGTMSGSRTVTSCTNGCTGTPWGNISHGTVRTGYLYTSAALPQGCSSYSASRTCSNGTLTGNASYNKASCTTTCSPYEGQYCGTAYETGCDSPLTSPLSHSYLWCTYPNAPYYQTGSVCSSNRVGPGDDGVYGNDDDMYSTSCWYSRPYNQYYRCDGSCY